VGSDLFARFQMVVKTSQSTTQKKSWDLKHHQRFRVGVLEGELKESLSKKRRENNQKFPQKGGEHEVKKE